MSRTVLKAGRLFFRGGVSTPEIINKREEGEIF
jgi:hypothetical protein